MRTLAYLTIFNVIELVAAHLKITHTLGFIGIFVGTFSFMVCAILDIGDIRKKFTK